MSGAAGGGGSYCWDLESTGGALCPGVGPAVSTHDENIKGVGGETGWEGMRWLMVVEKMSVEKRRKRGESPKGSPTSLGVAKDNGSNIWCLRVHSNRISANESNSALNKFLINSLGASREHNPRC